ncbi:MAG TPA: hypothetical protein IAB68_04225 [Candidatus Aphodocola excrementigallinarum]|uniref:Uncharacterized protein n=1 Tax=Candidatus Aphodocola excrementigallinarum TaxID=2840670 RepID=A0A9D1INE8_9FIRM|nr:hypothetical protein [Candidatus Aphodocola excrementigallinarum]
MNNEKIYIMDIKSKRYKKLEKGNIWNMLLNLFKVCIISAVLMLALSCIGDLILDIDVLFLVYIFIFINVYNVIRCIVKWVKYTKIGNTCIFKRNNEILILYGDTSKEILNSIGASSGVITGGIIAGSSSNIGKIVGSAISISSAMKGKNINNNDKDKINKIPNITIDDIINDPRTAYDYYKNVKFIKKNKNYLYFNGDKNNYDGSIKNKNFKIDRKLYKDIDDILN